MEESQTVQPLDAPRPDFNPRRSVVKDITELCDVILDANDPDFAEQFREAVGAKVRTPQESDR